MDMNTILVVFAVVAVVLAVLGAIIGCRHGFDRVWNTLMVGFATFALVFTGEGTMELSKGQFHLPMLLEHWKLLGSSYADYFAYGFDQGLWFVIITVSPAVLMTVIFGLLMAKSREKKGLNHILGCFGGVSQAVSYLAIFLLVMNYLA